jgi:hypothetical protein
MQSHVSRTPTDNRQAPAAVAVNDAIRSITGRDGYIIGQALYWFIREQQKLPEEQFEWSNTEDAKLILLTLFPGVAKHFAQEDQRAGRKPANLELEKYDRMMPTLLAADNVVNLKR